MSKAQQYLKAQVGADSGRPRGNASKVAFEPLMEPFQGPIKAMKTSWGPGTNDLAHDQT